MKTLHRIEKKIIRFSLIILCVLLVCACCHRKYLTKSTVTQWCEYPCTEIPRDSSILLWRKPGVTAKEFEHWKREHHLTGGRPACSFCNDNDLEIYDGVPIEMFGGTGGTDCTGTTICKPHGGGDDVVEYCYNIPIHLDTIEGGKYDYQLDSSQIPSENDISGPIVNVAVFDTGVDPAITSKYTIPLADVCYRPAARGWNFANGNDQTQDDFQGRHGTKVAKFIVDQVHAYKHQRVNIIPVKIFDRDGNTSLFKILCAFSYAQQSGIKIINASFGFYWHDLFNPPALFSDYIQTHLTDNGILLIASAGNRDISEDNAVTSTGLVSTADLRDLAKHPVYPAVLSGHLGNVITVTTVFSPQDAISLQQNHSKRFVMIGVNGDGQCTVTGVPAPTEEFCFRDPLDPTAVPVHGSSFATPIVTGRIASFYDLLTAGMGTTIDQGILLSRMQAQGLVKQSTAPVLPANIKNGVYAPKAP